MYVLQLQLSLHLNLWLFAITFATMSNPVAQQKLTVEGLRHESQVPRLKLSVTVKELVDFVRQNITQDPLIQGIDKKANHFIEKSSCDLL